MPLFPQSFVDDLKQHADIVVVVQDYVSLKKAGATYKGLCPFHAEKTPSFQVDRDKGFFHCFGCQVGGDVIKFIELHERVGFQDAVKMLAQRFGLALPELEQSDEQRTNAAERENLLKIHEAAAAWFREQLALPGAARVRKQIADRGIDEKLAREMGLGFAPPAREDLRQALTKQGFSQALLARAGLLVQRDDGSVADRFRNRLMIPIYRDTGSVIAFGGRSIDPDQQPKYLNSPETPIYSKSRTLYGLNLSKSAIRQRGFAVLVEGYFDFAQVHRAGLPVVACCGTALTPQQAQQLRRFTGRIVLSFDPDAAGQGAAAKSCEMLVAEGFDVNVAVLPAGEDPDTFVRKNGAAGYGARLTESRPYLDYLLDRAASRHNLGTAEGRTRLVAEMVPVAARIADKVRQQLFAEALSGKAMVSHDVVWAEIQKSAGTKTTNQSAKIQEGPSFGQVTKAERSLVWLLVHRPSDALDALTQLDAGDLEGLRTFSILDLAQKLNEDKGFSPSVLFQRLSDMEARLVTGIASEPEDTAWAAPFCVQQIRRLRYERERSMVQGEIDRIQMSGGDSSRLTELLVRKYELVQRIDALI